MVAYQQARSMPGVYNTTQPQQVMVPVVYKVPHSTMKVQSAGELHDNYVNPLVRNPSKPSGAISPGQSVLTNSSYQQSVLNKIIGHEPCIHTLKYLEDQIENQKQIGKSQSEQLKTLWEQSALQEKEIKRLKLECCAKERIIEALRSQIDVTKEVETQKAEVPRLRAVINEQREELKRLHKRSPNGRIKDTSKVSGLNISELEHSSLKQENEAFRLEIGRLERENSEIPRLREEVRELNRKLKESRPLRNIPAALDQSVSSTGLASRR